MKTAILDSEITITPLRFVRAIEVLGIVLPILALLVLAGSVAVAPDRRRAIERAGLAVAAAAATALAIFLVARSLALAQIEDPLNQDAVSALWDALLGGLFTGAIGVGIVAVILAAAARFGAADVDPLSPLTFAARRSLGAVRSGRSSASSAASRSPWSASA